MAKQTVRRGIRTSQTINPQDLIPIVDGALTKIKPFKNQLYSILDAGLKRSAPPAGTRRVQTIAYYEHDSLDFINGTAVAGTATETRYARLPVAQRNYLNTATEMFYEPGQKLALDNGQQVEVVMTPTKIHWDLVSLTTPLTGNTTTASAPGTIVVRNIEPVPIRDIASVQSFYDTGFAVREGDGVRANGIQSDVIYDCNYIEELEATFGFTKQELEYIEAKGIRHANKQWQQTVNLEKLKGEVENLLMFGTRAFDSTVKNLPKYHMGGLLYFVRDNVMTYNPDSVSNYEDLFQNWIEEHVFAQSPSGNTKLVLAGRGIWNKFQNEFRDYRRQNLSQSPTKNVSGLDFSEYTWGGQTIKVMFYDKWRANTKYNNWALAIDPASIELIEKNKFTITDLPKTEQSFRLQKYLIEWSGTIRVNNPQAHALLRTP